jgi:UrcA family protein
MKKFPTIQSSFVLFAAATALVCGGASLASGSDPPQRIVKFGELDLDKPAGVETLYRRLRSAAKEVCKPGISVPQTLRSKSRACTELTLADAVTQINHPNLTAYHDARISASAGGTKVAASR